VAVHPQTGVGELSDRSTLNNKMQRKIVEKGNGGRTRFAWCLGGARNDPCGNRGKKGREVGRGKKGLLAAGKI